MEPIVHVIYFIILQLGLSQQKLLRYLFCHMSIIFKSLYEFCKMFDSFLVVALFHTNGQQLGVLDSDLPTFGWTCASPVTDWWCKAHHLAASSNDSFEFGCWVWTYTMSIPTFTWCNVPIFLSILHFIVLTFEFFLFQSL